MFNILQVLSQTQQEIFVYTLWSIWKQRMISFGKMSIDCVLLSVIEEWIFYLAGKMLRKSVVERLCTFIRDEQGSFVLAKTKWISHILNVDEGEALTLFYVLR